MAYVSRFDLTVMLAVAWLVGVIFTDKLRRLQRENEEKPERVLITFGIGVGVIIVTVCTVAIAKLACGS